MGDFRSLERGDQVGGERVELFLGDSHPRVRGLHVLARVLERAARYGADQFHELPLQGGAIDAVLIVSREIHFRIGQGGFGKLMNDVRHGLLAAEPVPERLAEGRAGELRTAPAPLIFGPALFIIAGMEQGQGPVVMD